ANEAKADNEAEDTGHFWNRTDKQKAAVARISKREDIVSSTKDEVTDEMAFLQREAKKSGKPIDMADVDKLIERKELEHEIERKHAVNLTNESTSLWSGDKKRTQWTKKELDDVKDTLGKLPKNHVFDNPELREIHRGLYTDDAPVAQHGGGKVE